MLFSQNLHRRAPLGALASLLLDANLGASLYAAGLKLGLSRKGRAILSGGPGKVSSRTADSASGLAESGLEAAVKREPCDVASRLFVKTRCEQFKLLTKNASGFSEIQKRSLQALVQQELYKNLMESSWENIVEILMDVVNLHKIVSFSNPEEFLMVERPHPRGRVNVFQAAVIHEENGAIFKAVAGKQELFAQEWIAENLIRAMFYIDADNSGSKEEKTIFQRVLGKAHKGAAAGVIAYDAFFRGGKSFSFRKHTVKEIIKAGAKYETTPLMIAAKLGDKTIWDYFLDMVPVAGAELARAELARAARSPRPGSELLCLEDYMSKLSETELAKFREAKQREISKIMFQENAMGHTAYDILYQWGNGLLAPSPPEKPDAGKDSTS